MTDGTSPVEPQGGWRPVKKRGEEVSQSEPETQRAATSSAPPTAPTPRVPPAVASTPTPKPEKPKQQQQKKKKKKPGPEPVDLPTPNTGLMRFTGFVGPGIIAILAFAAPWVRLKVDGEPFFGITLSRRIVDLPQAAAYDLPSSGPGWAIALTVVAVGIALHTMAAETLEDAAGRVSGGGLLLGIGVLAAWLGRSLWLNTDNAPDGLTLHNAWGYWVALLVAAALVVVPWFVVVAEEEKG